MAKGAEYAEVIENIDIGGPAMIRSAAKNHGFVNVVVDVEDYDAVLAELAANDGQTTYALRQRLAQTAYARTAAYDTAVSTWMATQSAAHRAAARLAARWRRPCATAKTRTSRRRSTPMGLARPGWPPRAASGQRAVLQQHQRHRCGV